jgi:hypothetical protein
MHRDGSVGFTSAGVQNDTTKELLFADQNTVVYIVSPTDNY